jgi:hypothetical protein
MPESKADQQLQCDGNIDFKPRRDAAKRVFVECKCKQGGRVEKTPTCGRTFVAVNRAIWASSGRQLLCTQISLARPESRLLIASAFVPAILNLAKRSLEPREGEFSREPLEE